MIVRLQQIDPSDAEALAFWETTDARGPIQFSWPADWYAYQITALDRDEQQQPVPESLRRRRLRQLMPNIIAGLGTSECRTVLRFDGPLIDGELAAAYRSLGDSAAIERYSLSAVEQFDPRKSPAIASMRLLPTVRHVQSMCNEAQIGLEKSVRLRAFCVLEKLVDPLLDTSDLDDERWRELLPTMRYVLSTVKGLLSLVVWTPVFAPEQMKKLALGTPG